MDAPFYPVTDSTSHKGGGSIISITNASVGTFLSRTTYSMTLWTMWLYVLTTVRLWAGVQTRKNYWHCWED